jgi:hypothetical protein
MFFIVQQQHCIRKAGEYMWGKEKDGDFPTQKNGGIKLSSPTRKVTPQTIRDYIIYWGLINQQQTPTVFVQSSIVIYSNGSPCGWFGSLRMMQSGAHRR